MKSLARQTSFWAAMSCAVLIVLGAELPIWAYSAMGIFAGAALAASTFIPDAKQLQSH